MRKIVLIAGLACCASVCLAAGSVPPRLTGQELVERYGKAETDLHTLRDQSYLDGYLAGAADAVEGKAWCNTTKVKRGEIDSMIVEAVRELGPEAQRSNAAPLLIAALKRRFPCPTGRNGR